VEITSETLESRQVQLTIVVPEEMIDAEMHEIAQAYARREGISGYRPGKVPVSRVAAIVGEDVLRETAVEGITETAARQAIKEQGLVPSAPASVEVIEQEPLTLKVIVPLEPKVDLGDYRSLRVERPEPEPVPEEAVEATIERWRDDHSSVESVDRPAEEDDVVLVALTGRIVGHTGAHQEDDDAENDTDADAGGAEGEVFYEEDSLSLTLSEVGTRQALLPPGVADELIGLSAGDTHSFVVQYPPEWPQTELAGRDVAFEARVEAVSSRVAPDLNDDFAQEISGLSSMEELRKRLREQLEGRALIDAGEAYVGEVVDTLVESADVEYPPALLEQEVAGMLADLRQRVESQGFTWDRWLEMQGKTEDALWEEVEPEAEMRLRRRLVMSKFVEEEGIELSRAEVDAEVRRITKSLPKAARRGMPSDDEMRRDAGSRLLTGRAIDRLIAIAEGRLEEDAGGDDAVGEDAAGDDTAGEDAAGEDERGEED
jgi:trigger factor